MKSVYCQAHGGSHYLRAIRTQLELNFNVVMCKPRRDFTRAGEIALVRDPRDRIVSQYRYWVKKKQKRIIQLEDEYPDMDERLVRLMLFKDGKSHLNYFKATLYFTEVLQKSGCEIIHFEELVNGGWAMERLLELLGSKRKAGKVYTKAFGNSRTYTGKFSNHREWFGEKCNALWSEHKDLLEMMGYVN